MIRFLAIASAAVGLLTGVALASSVKPIPGEWHSTTASHLNFTVNGPGTKIKGFETSCGPTFPGAKIKADGRFKLTTRLSIMGGKPQTLKISGRFTTAATATGSISYGPHCKYKFRATASNPPKPPADPAVPTDPSPATP